VISTELTGSSASRDFSVHGPPTSHRGRDGLLVQVVIQLQEVQECLPHAFHC
jgi:hypothetical protein